MLEEKRFYFLELNPRLQVEHPVTEWIANINIPACQVMIGMGIPLQSMADIRVLYGRQADSKAIDLEHEPQVLICPLLSYTSVRVCLERHLPCRVLATTGPPYACNSQRAVRC